MMTRRSASSVLLLAVIGITTSPGQDNAPGMTTALDYFGDPKVFWDSDQDGWDDLWVELNYRNIKRPFNFNLDSDGDGLTDYHEMVLWRDPWTQDPLPRKLTPEEQRLAQIESERQAKIQAEEEKKKWAQRKKELEPMKGVTPDDEKELQRKREEDLKKVLEKLRELPNIEFTPSLNSLSQINHSFANVLQLGPDDPSFQVWGEGQTIALGEKAPPYAMHLDFGGRVVATGFAPSLSPNDHASKTAGVIASSGITNSQGRGIASKAKVEISPWLAGSAKVANWALMSNKDISAHPYGLTLWSEGEVSFPTGSDQFHYQFQSRPDVTRNEPNFCGMYTSDAAFIDAIKAGAPDHLYVQSATNVRGDGFGAGDFPRFPPPTGEDGYFVALNSNNEWYIDQTLDWPWYAGHADNGKDSLPPTSVAKNALVVGGVMSNDSPAPGSGWGPTDDGRIKPDMVTLSYDVTTAVSVPNHDTPDETDFSHSYSTASGTSFSTPAVAAGAALLAETRQRRQGPKLKGASLKAILLATARDIGLPGPDPQTGFGAMDLARAVRLVHGDKNSSHIREVTVKSDEPVKFQVKALTGTAGGLTPSNMRLKVFICWDDPAFVPAASTLGTVDQSIKTLVNDLDLIVKKPGDDDPYEPIALNTGSGRAYAVNDTDNVEQVEVYEEGISNAERVFNIEVRAPNTMAGSQACTIVLQGIDTTFTPTPGGDVPPPSGSNPPSTTPSIERTGISEFTLVWPTIAGRSYDIESSTDLENWTPVTSDIKASSYYTSYPVPAPEDKGFYRVIAVEDPEVVLPPVAAEP